jgi:DNA-binding CsgD family transcriptional regulator
MKRWDGSPVLLSRQVAIASALYANGATIRLVAEVLGIGHETAKTYVDRARLVLGVSSKFELLDALNTPGMWQFSGRGRRRS